MIEVMVSVVIISVVIAALFQMKGNSSHIFLELGRKVAVSQFSSFLIANKNYGFENKTVTLDKLIYDFDVEDDLRRRFKESKMKVIYQVLESIDMSESAEIEDVNNEDKLVNSSLIFEIGKTILITDTSSSGLLRLRIQ
ncbi:hypothetical protein HUE87_08365 [Candidatus Sulfurimonas marisnigri]|uniref:Type II secretion system protein n=1 Tax=Candidatus Sulfurimonas marisnigri TaxID=2740405 RepID=A0A7S7RP23_9BACT|nr:hypothetical protein [Candidatus Sulfurimonas marisnigri]QOY53907.1 hypothetical protein HUE87_08365 [Candidatus Sulfurimonas marisnigri]